MSQPYLPGSGERAGSCGLVKVKREGPLRNLQNQTVTANLATLVRSTLVSLCLRSSASQHQSARGLGKVMQALRTARTLALQASRATQASSGYASVLD